VRSRCAGFLAVSAALVGALFVGATSTAAPLPTSGSAYPWVQRWGVHGTAAPAVGQWTQPGASVTVMLPRESALGTVGLQTSYSWVQPWQIAAGSVPDVVNDNLG